MPEPAIPQPLVVTLFAHVFGSERLTGTLLDRLIYHVHILEMHGESYRLERSRENAASQVPEGLEDA